MNENINNPDYKEITPFKGWVIENFPFIEADFDAITNYQLISKVVEYLNQVIANENLTEQQIETLTTAYNNLENYVNNYFDNLDVQQEINTKLDEMAQDGTLTNLIKEYIDPIYEAYESEINGEINDINSTVEGMGTSINTLTSRMNEFSTLTEGSTSGDAELADIRVGFEGTTYANAGDAVRGQAEFLNNQIELKNKYKRVQVLKQKATKDYKYILLPNHKYVINYGNALFQTSCTLYSTPTYNSSEETNVQLWNLSAKPKLISISASNDYRSLHIWQQNSSESDIEFVLYDVTENVEFESTCTEIPLYFYNGGYGDSEYIDDTAHNKVALPGIPLPGIYLITFPDELYVKTPIPVSGYTNPRQNISFYHPFSIKKSEDYSVFISFAYKDNSALRVGDEILSQIKVYCIYSNNEYDVTVGHTSTPTYLKNKCDIVTTDSNSNEILASIFGSDNDIKALIMDGTYNINKFYTMEDGSHCSLPLVKNGSLLHETNIVRKIIDISGRSMTTPQQINNVVFKVNETAHNLIDDNDYFILGTPYVNGNEIQRFRVAIKLSNINIIGWLYNKPLTYIDLTSCLSTELDSVNVRSWHENIDTYTAFDDTPDPECTGIRVGRGSNYGIQNYVKHSNVWYCGKGIACNGEHFIFEDVKTHHDYVGWYFGDKLTVGKMEHPNIMLGCSIEGCYRFMVLSKSGITVEQDYNSSLNVSRSTLIVEGLSTEDIWTIPVNEQVENESTTQVTLPILEIVRGAYRGRIEMDNSNSNIFASGSGNGFIKFRYTGSKLILSKGTNVDNYL